MATVQGREALDGGYAPLPHVEKVGRGDPTYQTRVSRFFGPNPIPDLQ